MYHDIARPDERENLGFPGPLAARYKLDPDHFAAHLAAIAATAPHVVTLDRDEPDDTGRGRVLITFDDGGGSALAAARALEERGWRGQFFITTSLLGTSGFLSPGDVSELAQRGHVIGSHSHSHPTYMGRLGVRELASEWGTSRQILSEILGAPPRTASVPGGFLSRSVIATAAAAGYELLFTSEPTARVQHGAITVRGRYTIWATTPASVAAAYARGDRLACSRLWLEWNAKKLAKRVSPSVYQQLRGVRARGA